MRNELIISRRNKKHVFLLSFIMFIAISSLQAGWIVNENKTMGETTTATTYYYQEDKVKIVEQDFTIIIDVIKGNAIIINTKNKSYWQGSINNLPMELGLNRDAEMKEFIEKLPPEQKAEFEKMAQEISGPKESAKDKEREFNAVPSGGEDEIAGYGTSKYDVFVDKKFKDEIWLANGFTLKGEIDLERMINFFNIIFRNTGRLYPLYEEYAQLFSKGYMMKRAVNSANDKIFFEVTKVQKKDLKKENFILPEGFVEKTVLDVVRVK